VDSKTKELKEVTSSKWMIPFKNRRMTKVILDKNQIEVVTVDNLTQLITYDVLVICTGAEYNAPWRDRYDQTLNAYERD
jgi:NADH dehydrogenase FAD-containing subunit